MKKLAFFLVFKLFLINLRQIIHLMFKSQGQMTVMMKRLSALFGSRKVGSTSVLPKRVWHCIQFALLFILTFMVISLSYAQSSKKAILERSGNSITFSVDGKLSSPKVGKMPMDNERIISEFLEGNRLQGSRTIIKSSFDGESVYYEGPDVFFHFMVDAYANHRSVVFTPDDIWMLISQAFARHVNDNAEALRDKIVNHDKKITLNVQTGIDLYSPDADWNSIFRTFEEKIAENTKADIAKLMVADFSTTGTVERIASEITLMNATKAYFNFLVTYMGCGIPSITLEGTTADWEKVESRAMALEQYGMGWWTSELKPILAEFVKASRGKINQSFWKSIVRKQLVNELDRGNCGMGDITELDGWFLRLIPFDKKGRTPSSVLCTTSDMTENIVSVDFLYHQMTDTSNKTIPMTLWAGFVGSESDSRPNTVRLKHGWFVTEGNAEQRMIQQLRSHPGEPLIIDGEIPEQLRKVDYLPSITLMTSHDISVPQWLNELRIDRINFRCNDGANPDKLYSQLKEVYHGTVSRPKTDGESVFAPLGLEDDVTLDAERSYAPDDYVFNNYTSMFGGAGKDATFDGGIEQYINEHRQYTLPESSTEKRINVDVDFIVEKDGSISDPFISFTVPSSSYGFDGDIVPDSVAIKNAEADLLRVVRSMGKWKPAVNKYGQPIRSHKNIFYTYTKKKNRE